MLDKKDLDILEMLKVDSRAPTKKIAKQLSIPLTTVHNRIKKLQKEGVISRFTIEINEKKRGKAALAYILVSMDYKYLNAKNLSQIDTAQKLMKHPLVEKSSIITGSKDMLLTIRAENVDAIGNFVTSDLRAMEGVDKSETLVVLYDSPGC